LLCQRPVLKGDDDLVAFLLKTRLFGNRQKEPLVSLDVIFLHIGVSDFIAL